MFFNFSDQKFIYRQQQNSTRILTWVIPIEKVDSSSIHKRCPQWRGGKGSKFGQDLLMNTYVVVKTCRRLLWMVPNVSTLHWQIKLSHHFILLLDREREFERWSGEAFYQQGQRHGYLRRFGWDRHSDPESITPFGNSYHTIRKCSKMDGQKYIPFFAFK